MILRLHSFWRSTSSWRVRIGLGLKGLAWEYSPVDLAAQAQYRPEHLARNPMAQVPVLELLEDGRPPVRLVQSMAILAWLDEAYPSPPLLPADPLGRARVRALAEHVNSSIQPYQNAAVLRHLRGALGADDRAWAAHWIGRGLAALEAATAAGAGRFSHGDQVGLADVYLVPQLDGARRHGVALDPFPTLLRVEAACAALPAFRAAIPERQPDAPPAGGAP